MRSNEVADKVEAAVKQLVTRINNDVTPEKVAGTIAEHTKAIIGRTTAESRANLHNLFDVLKNIDEHLTANEELLRAEIDNHVKISNGAFQAASLLKQTLKGWVDSLEFKSNSKGE
jgi:predicted RNA binding protein with dsRBD fold (UPF0201 family)